MTFTITSQPYLDRFNKCYKNILTINQVPRGPLSKYVQRIQLPRLSPFQVVGPCNTIEKCTLAILNPCNSTIDYGCCINGGFFFMTPNDIPFLYNFLLNNGYQIETQLTNMMNQSDVKIGNNKTFICMATYYGNKPTNITYMR
jgi:hypothetical protein